MGLSPKALSPVLATSHIVSPLGSLPMSPTLTPPRRMEDKRSPLALPWPQGRPKAFASGNKKPVSSKSSDKGE